MAEALVAVLAAHVAIAVLAAALGRRAPRGSLLVGALAPLATTGWLAAATPRVLGGRAVEASGAWVEGLDIAFGLRVDAFALLMGWLVGVVGVLVFWYAYAYFDAGTERLGRFTATLVLFSASMLGLVVADDVFTLFLFWELTSVASFLLIGFDHRDDGARASALQALLVTVAGGMAMLGGLVLLAIEAGSASLSAWSAQPPRAGLVPAGLVLVVAGAMAKSAQFPLHSGCRARWPPPPRCRPTCIRPRW